MRDLGSVFDRPSVLELSSAAFVAMLQSAALRIFENQKLMLENQILGLKG